MIAIAAGPNLANFTKGIQIKSKFSIINYCIIIISTDHRKGILCRSLPLFTLQVFSRNVPRMCVRVTRLCKGVF